MARLPRSVKITLFRTDSLSEVEGLVELLTRAEGAGLLAKTLAEPISVPAESNFGGTAQNITLFLRHDMQTIEAAVEFGGLLSRLIGLARKPHKALSIDKDSTYYLALYHLHEDEGEHKPRIIETKGPMTAECNHEKISCPGFEAAELSECRLVYFVLREGRFNKSRFYLFKPSGELCAAFCSRTFHSWWARITFKLKGKL